MGFFKGLKDDVSQTEKSGKGTPEFKVVNEDTMEMTVEETETDEPILEDEIGILEESLAVETTKPVENSALDETTVITASTKLIGDITTEGSVNIQGDLTGNVECKGKLVITGIMKGDSTSSEFYADAAKVEGEVVSTGVVKIGADSVIIGNISASSAVIAGAVKGDIDVQGPVVIDTTAVIMGNIKSRSVQINNGAVIEGFCSQCYNDVDVQSVFENNN